MKLRASRNAQEPQPRIAAFTRTAYDVAVLEGRLPEGCLIAPRQEFT